MVNKDVFGSSCASLQPVSLSRGPYRAHFLCSLPGVSSWNTIQHIFLQTRTNISTYLNTYIVLQHVSTFHTVYKYIITQHVCIFHSSNSYLQAYMDMGLSNLTQASIHWFYDYKTCFKQFQKSTHIVVWLSVWFKPNMHMGQWCRWRFHLSAIHSTV